MLSSNTASTWAVFVSRYCYLSPTANLKLTTIESVLKRAACTMWGRYLLRKDVLSAW